MLVLGKGLIGFALLGAILWRFDVHTVIHLMSEYRVEYVVACAALFLSGCLVSVWRWQIFVPEFGFFALLRYSFIGQLYSVILPGQVAGEVVKAYRIARGQSEKARVAASVLIDRVIGTLALLSLGCIGLWLSPRSVSAILSLSFLAAIALICASLIGLRMPVLYSYATSVLERLKGYGPRSTRVAGSIANFFGIWREYGRVPVRLFASFGLGLVFQFLAVAIYAVFAHALGIEVALTDWLWITAIVSLAVILPVSIAGIGLREGALVGTLGYLGVQGERALALSFGIFALTLFGAVIGLIADVLDRPQSPHGKRI